MVTKNGGSGDRLHVESSTSSAFLFQRIKKGKRLGESRSDVRLASSFSFNRWFGNRHAIRRIAGQSLFPSPVIHINDEPPLASSRIVDEEPNGKERVGHDARIESSPTFLFPWHDSHTSPRLTRERISKTGPKMAHRKEVHQEPSS